MTNLTAADPFVLPLAMALFNLAIIEVSFYRFEISIKKKKDHGIFLILFKRADKLYE